MPPQDFLQLGRRRVRDVLLISSLFDLYLFEEAGLLYETAEFMRVSRGDEALALLERGVRFDLIITTLHIEDMTPLKLARELRGRGVTTPIVLLAYDKRELAELLTARSAGDFDRIFIWRGDVRLLTAIIRNIEDEWNVDADTENFGVQVILLNEDSVRYASFFLPLLYSEVMEQAQKLIAEGVNPAHRALRMRARPKIILSRTWEEAVRAFDRHREHVIGVITDAGFRRNREHDPQAGIAFAARVKSILWDVPVLVQSTNAELASAAESSGAMFVAKDSPQLEEEVRRVLRDYFGFGDFVFRRGDEEVARATDLKSLEEQLRVVPDDILLQHASRNDFSNWFKARTEFELAQRLRPRKPDDYASVAEMREDIIRQLHAHRASRQRSLLGEFSAATFDPAMSFARTGAGSLGGKARGLAFVNTLLAMYDVHEHFRGLDVEVPAGIVVATGAFDRFVEMNGLHGLAGASDEEIQQRFIAAREFPSDVAERLRELLEICREPLAVRSSSLLEDTQFHPFAGVYQTYMIPNRDLDPDVRLAELLTAIKRVYASTFYRAAREYIRVTSLRVEDEKMAVIVQRMVGSQHGDRFYPEISGVARSYNFYPAGPQTPEDGIASVALGLGKTIVEGGATVRFCPKYPDHHQELLRETQRKFYALNMVEDRQSCPSPPSIEDERIVPFDLADAEGDGTLQWVASTWSAENDALYDGISRPGTRVVTFAPILRHHLLPLADALDYLCKLGSRGIGTPVEIEFAVDLSGSTKKLAVLQMRPLVLSREMDELEIDDIPKEELLCESAQVLGHGVIRDLRDIVVVGIDTFERSRSREVAREIAKINSRLLDEHRGYLLVGPGRWGSGDPLLGIPVKWEQISGARAIVESAFRDLSVDPSQGSHFFQNLTAFQVGYFSVNPRVRNSFIDWEWLAALPAMANGRFARHIRLDHGVTVKMNGRERRGVILKA